MTALGVATTWIAISVVGAKGLTVFARAAASSELEVDLYPVDPHPVSPESCLSDKSAHFNEAQAHKAGSQVHPAGEAQTHAMGARS